MSIETKIRQCEGVLANMKAKVLQLQTDLDRAEKALSDLKAQIKEGELIQEGGN